MYYFTADLHFGHRNIIEYCNRPFKNVEEMDQALIDNWNSVVTGADVIVIVGDFTLDSNPERVRYMYTQYLKGNKIFIKGNHDHFLRGSEKRYMWIKKVMGQMVHCSHYPLRTWAASNRQTCWQLHGHCHGMQIPYENQYDVGVDNNGYFPVSLTQLRSIIPISNSLGEGRSSLDRPEKRMSFVEIQEAER